MFWKLGREWGCLTQFLLQRSELNIKVIEIDRDSVAYLAATFSSIEIFSDEDFLKSDYFKAFYRKTLVSLETFRIIFLHKFFLGSQINEIRLPEVVGMIQKEVAERIASSHGNKTYGILSVLLQAFYKLNIYSRFRKTFFRLLQK